MDLPLPEEKEFRTLPFGSNSFVQKYTGELCVEVYACSLLKKSSVLCSFFAFVLDALLNMCTVRQMPRVSMYWCQLHWGQGGPLFCVRRNNNLQESNSLLVVEDSGLRDIELSSGIAISSRGVYEKIIFPRNVRSIYEALIAKIECA